MMSSPPYNCVAEAVVDYLVDRDVRHVFVVPGLQIDPLVAALANHPTMVPIVANHELTSGYMADGYARASGGIGASFAIGGPGSAALIGAAVTAKADRSPVLFVTGNIPSADQGRGAFQDAGTMGSNDAEIFGAAVGVSLRCGQADELAPTLVEAARWLALQRPVHLAIAMDVQACVVDAMDDVKPVKSRDKNAPDHVADHLTALPAPDWLARGRVLLVVDKNALALAQTIATAAQTFSLPVASDIHARGIVPEEAAHSVGHLGFMPHPRALAALDDRNALYAERVVAVGCDDGFLRVVQGHHGRVQMVSIAALSTWLASSPVLPDAGEQIARNNWLNQLAAVHRREPTQPTDNRGLSYADVVDSVVTCMPLETMYVVDAGQVRRVATARLLCHQPNTLLVAAGMAPMGWSLGAAIGAKLAQPERPVVALLGDGSMRMHGIEMATAVRYQLPILYVLFDNDAYGSVLARMRNLAEADTARLPPVDWIAFAKAFGVETASASDTAELHHALAGAHSLCKPRLIVARVPAVNPDAGASMDANASAQGLNDKYWE